DDREDSRRQRQRRTADVLAPREAAVATLVRQRSPKHHSKQTGDDEHHSGYARARPERACLGEYHNGFWRGRSCRHPYQPFANVVANRAFGSSRRWYHALMSPGAAMNSTISACSTKTRSTVTPAADCI